MLIYIETSRKISDDKKMKFLNQFEVTGSKSCKSLLKFLREKVIIRINPDKDIVLTVF